MLKFVLFLSALLSDPGMSFWECCKMVSLRRNSLSFYIPFLTSMFMDGVGSCKIRHNSQKIPFFIWSTSGGLGTPWDPWPKREGTGAQGVDGTKAGKLRDTEEDMGLLDEEGFVLTLIPYTQSPLTNSPYSCACRPTRPTTCAGCSSLCKAHRKLSTGCVQWCWAVTPNHCDLYAWEDHCALVQLASW